MGDAFGDALDEADEDEQPGQSLDDEDATQSFINRSSHRSRCACSGCLEAFRSNNGSGVQDSTVGFAVTEELHYLYRELSNADEVDADLRQQFRDQIERMANRHPEVADRARRKYELDNE